MSISIEILPTIPLNDGWHKTLCSHLSKNRNIVSLRTLSDHYFRLVYNDLPLFHLWLSEKESEIFPDNTYLEGIKNINKLNIEQFYIQFGQINYSIRLESKPFRQEGEVALMLEATQILAELTNGVILFGNNIFEYKVDYIYFADEIRS